MGELDGLTISIPTRRKPPILTLESYGAPAHVIVLSDPEVFEDHKEYYRDMSGIQVVLGKQGQGPQNSALYSTAHTLGYLYFFKLDDDLPPKTFIHKDGHYPSLEEAIVEARRCIVETETSHAGFANGSNRHWMSIGYGRTWGLIHGGANIARSSPDGDKFCDPRVRCEDVYRTCAHREQDGAVGRVKHIGFDKKKSTVVAGNSNRMETLTQELFEADREFILNRFPGMVTCDGSREVNGVIIPNWRMRRG